MSPDLSPPPMPRRRPPRREGILPYGSGRARALLLAVGQLPLQAASSLGAASAPLREQFFVQEWHGRSLLSAWARLKGLSPASQSTQSRSVKGKAGGPLAWGFRAVLE